MEPIQKVAAQPERPLLLFDGDCRFCRRWATRWRNATGDAVYYLPFQDERVAQWFPEISTDALSEKIHLVEPDGSVHTGAKAAVRALAVAPQKKWLRWVFEKIPLVEVAAERVYGFVARNRRMLSGATRWLTGSSMEAPTYVLTRSIFLKSLGVIYLIAFLSWWTQQSALIGSNGILPAAQLMEAMERTATEQGWSSWERFRALPTLCWLSASDGFLNFLCAGGVVMAVLLILGIAPMLMTIGLLLFYMSLARVGGNFMSFQWDYLLLEAGFLAIFFAPLNPLPLWVRNWWKRKNGALDTRALPSQPSRIALLLLWLLLFKLMFMSGIVKLVPPPGMQPDQTWHDWTALTYHYWTQPLPMPTAWWAAQLPLWFQKFSCGAMFFIEIWLPFLFFAPRRLRLFACAGQILLQLGIMATGNYTFFNLLTITLCFTLIDDATWRQMGAFLWRIVRWRKREPVTEPVDAPLPPMRMMAGSHFWWLRWLGNGTRLYVAWLVGVIAFVYVVSARYPALDWQPWISRHIQSVGSFGIANGYGLFRYMTLTRPELIVEGSHDQQRWQEYHFKYKAGDLARAPRMNQPHQPRLDWQMWFEALHAERVLAMRRGQPNVWFQSFLIHLLRGTPEVISLLEENPFDERPPRFVRVTLYQYKFTTPAERAESGNWWKRERAGVYVPPVSLEQVRR